MSASQQQYKIKVSVVINTVTLCLMSLLAKYFCKAQDRGLHICTLEDTCSVLSSEMAAVSIGIM